MKKNTCTLLVASMLLFGMAIAEQKLGFVIEFVRHGARAPIYSNAGNFLVPPGCLTAQGMRQRYLLGKMNRQRYIDEYKLVDDTYNPSQMYIQSTNVLRTIQSSYSELIGLYPPLKQPSMSQGEKISLKSGKGMPKIKISNANSNQNDIDALKDDPSVGYQYIPVFNYVNTDANDDVSSQGCDYAQQQANQRGKDNSTYYGVKDFIFPIIRKPFQQAFKLTDKQAYALSFSNLNDMEDTTLAENMEGLPPRFIYSEDQWYALRNIQKYNLISPFEGKARQLWATKMLQKPLGNMTNRFNEIINGKEDIRDSMRYFIHSSHDTQLANLLEFINPDKHEWIDMTYDSTILFELFYDSDCVKTATKDQDLNCFTVHSSHSGTPLKFDTCLDANKSRGSKSKVCTYRDFLTHLAKYQFQGDLQSECQKPYLG
ncbi:major acid phosphatase map (histidine-acid phosphatase) [Stylonychia lemnae]|uniref:Major acid phosphatase map (Histidine-acid phosphatase) n=1 Tax=Stylonychia lemnae TaxID=5949 RepID=A0A078A9W2_STYLE|nr:major acid phosphatase map (histidine-acid phosphatase) [Stylonychia lemnae]|eukprot:CDW77588.1 major acid phosphatase map (histidine-acid phosphatase) [Stylonychia lemnae]